VLAHAGALLTQQTVRATGRRRRGGEEEKRRGEDECSGNARQRGERSNHLIAVAA